MLLSSFNLWMSNLKTCIKLTAMCYPGHGEVDTDEHYPPKSDIGSSMWFWNKKFKSNLTLRGMWLTIYLKIFPELLQISSWTFSVGSHSQPWEASSTKLACYSFPFGFEIEIGGHVNSILHIYIFSPRGGRGGGVGVGIGLGRWGGRKTNMIRRKSVWSVILAEW